MQLIKSIQRSFEDFIIGILESVIRDIENTPPLALAALGVALIMTIYAIKH